MKHIFRIARFFALALGLLGGQAFASETAPNCGGLNQRACSLFDSVFWANNSGFCDFGLKSSKGILTALSGGATGTCVNDTRQTVAQDNSWIGWALRKQRYGIQKDLPINYVTHLGTHNSYSNYADKDNNWLSTNQYYSITDQLNQGARVIRLDPHYYFGEMRLCHSETNDIEVPSAKKVLESCTSQAIGQYLPIAFLLAPHLTEIHLLPTPIPEVIDGYLGSILAQAAIKGSIAINNRLYANGIREVADWLNDNPGEFIILMGDDYSEGHDDLINTPIQTYLGSKVWSPADQSNYVAGGKAGWPHMADLQQQGKQLIVFGKHQGTADATHGGKWIFSENDNVTSIFPKKDGTGGTEATATDNPSFTGCTPRTQPFTDTTWLQTGEGLTGSDYLFNTFTGFLTTARVQHAVNCGFSNLRLDFFMAPDRAYSQYRQSGPDLRREAAIWSYDQDDFGQAGPAVMKASNGRWTSVNLGTVMYLACASNDPTQKRQWTVSKTADTYFAGNGVHDPCKSWGDFSFAAPRTAAENQDLWTQVQFSSIPQVMLNVAAIVIPPAYISPSYLKQYMDRGGIAPDQLVEQVDGFNNLFFTPKLTTNTSNALSIVQPTGTLPTSLDGGFIPTVMTYDQSVAQSLPTGGYSAVNTLTIWSQETLALGQKFFVEVPVSPAVAAPVSLQVLEPTVTHLNSNQILVEPLQKATFTVQVAPQCGVKPVDPIAQGIIPITGGVTFTDVYTPSYGGPPVTTLLGTIPINNNPAKASDNDNGVMHAIIDIAGCGDDTVCAYTNSLGEGTHNITAIYSQDGFYGNSSSRTYTLTAIDPAMPGGRINLTLGGTASQVYTISGTPGMTWQVLPGPHVTVSATSGRFTATTASVTVSILDSPDLLPGILDTNINVHRDLSDGTEITDAYQPVRITVPTRISVAQSPLSFSATDNVPSSGQQIAVTYDGGPLTITADVATPQQWLAAALNPTGTQTRGSQTVQVAVNVNPAGLAAGHYTGALHIGAPSGPGVFSVAVSLDVFLTGPQYTISTNPPGLRVTVDGVEQATPVTFQWLQGSPHVLSTPAGFQGVVEGQRAIWTSWSDGGAIAHYVTAAGSKNYTAAFRVQYQFSSQKSPVCGGTVTPAGNWFDAGTFAHPSATAAQGFAFSGFTGDASSNSSVLNLFMDGPHSVTANFACTVQPCPVVLPVVYATGDLNHDGRVDCADVAIVKAALGKKTGQPGFDPRADVNADGVIDVRDLAVVTQQLPKGTVCQ